jgi:hypothetical protein
MHSHAVTVGAFAVAAVGGSFLRILAAVAVMVAVVVLVQEEELQL